MTEKGPVTENEQPTEELERIMLSGPTMYELHPRMKALLAGGWRMTDMVKPTLEGFGEVKVWFERPRSQRREDDQ